MVFKNDRYVQMDDLNQMKFLEQCIKETLRMFTLIPITFRRATEDITLNGMYCINTAYLINPYPEKINKIFSNCIYR